MEEEEVNGVEEENDPKWDDADTIIPEEEVPLSQASNSGNDQAGEDEEDDSTRSDPWQDGTVEARAHHRAQVLYEEYTKERLEEAFAPGNIHGVFHSIQEARGLKVESTRMTVQLLKITGPEGVLYFEGGEVTNMHNYDHVTPAMGMHEALKNVMLGMFMMNPRAFLANLRQIGL